MRRISACNYSGVCRAIVLLDHVGSVAGERDLVGDERIVAERGHGLQVAGDAGIGLAIGLRAKSARHFHFHL